ncbi:MAG: hypothetical protein J6W28_01215 [Clostridia bacterium]|nr:hypothetical protein [Clostridia bacterium]MBO7169777.1 hypothetical protein [Clostridia bacterium]
MKASESEENRGMEKERFASACARIVGREYERDTIGLLGEKTMHAVLKDFMEPDHAFHEKKVEGYVADILRDDAIIEIQTRAFDRLLPKLKAFLPLYHVTVVYPIPAVKYLSWVKEDGSVTPLRRVPKKGSFFDAGRELERILPYLTHPSLSVKLLLVDMEEYRLQNGWGKDKKRGAERHDRIPLALSDSLLLQDVASFAALLPPSLSSPFTRKEFKKAIRGGPKNTISLLRVLCEMGIVTQTGKRGNALLYEKR